MMEQQNLCTVHSFDKLDEQIKLPFNQPPKFLGYLNQTAANISKKRKTLIVKKQENKKRNLTVRFNQEPAHNNQEYLNKIEGLEQFTLPKAKVLGKMIDNKLHGYCQVTYNDGSVFKGQYNMGSKISGVFYFYDKTRYQGEFLNENFHGEGKFVFQSGKTIEGRWNQAKIQGNGKIVYPNGDIYYGQIQDLKKHGSGCLYFANNTKYIGQFHNGYIQGHGMFYQSDQTMVEGQWNKGKLVKKD